MITVSTFQAGTDAYAAGHSSIMHAQAAASTSRPFYALAVHDEALLSAGNAHMPLECCFMLHVWARMMRLGSFELISGRAGIQ